MKLILKLMPLLIVLSCQVSDKSSGDSISNTEPKKVSKYRYFDLSKMEGIEPYAGDSCVTVTERGDSVTISVKEPKRYSITFSRYKDYWHAGGYINTDIQWCQSKYAGPMRIDMFVRNDTLFKYRQEISSCQDGLIYGEIQVITGNKLEEKTIEDDNCILITDKSEILQIISSINNFEVLEERNWTGSKTLFDALYNKQCYRIIRNKKYVIIEHENKLENNHIVDTCYYPEIQIWGTVEFGLKDVERSLEED